MADAANWAGWIAVSTLLIGVGRFLDGDRLSSRATDRVRGVLVAAFAYVARPTRPDLFSALVRAVSWPFRRNWAVRIGVLAGCFVLIAWLCAIAALIWATYALPPNTPFNELLEVAARILPYRRANLLLWLFYLGSLISAGLMAFLSVAFVVRVVSTRALWLRVLSLLLVVTAVLLLMAAEYVVRRFVSHGVAWYWFIPLDRLASVVAFAPALALSLFAASLTALRLVLLGLQLVFGAPHLTNAPFTVLASLIAMLALLGKLISELA